MTEPIASPMKIDADDSSEDLPEEWGESGDGESLPAAEQDWVDENENASDEGE